MLAPPDRPFLRTAAFGTLCGLFAALAYTACNICLRAAAGVDPFLVAALRAFPTVAMLAPVMLARPRSGLPIWPTARVVGILIVGGLLAHVAGNSLFQYALGIVGMALAVPLCLGAMIFAGATIGRVVLNEPVTPRMAVGLLMLIASIFVLSGGAQAAQRAMDAERQTGTQSAESPGHTAGELALGVGAACSAGLCYATIGAALRHAGPQVSIAQSLTIVSGAGLAALIVICPFTVSGEDLASTSLADFLTVLLAGVFNAAAFIALTRALQLTSLVYVHALNATQATMAAIAGVLIFGEPTSAFLLSGLALTIAGLAFMQGGRKSIMTHDEGSMNTESK